MPHNITGSGVFTNPVPTYADGDAVSQASNDPAIQALANRDVWSKPLARALISGTNTTKPTIIFQDGGIVDAVYGGVDGPGCMHVTFSNPGNHNYIVLVTQTYPSTAVGLDHIDATSFEIQFWNIQSNILQNVKNTDSRMNILVMPVF